MQRVEEHTVPIAFPSQCARLTCCAIFFLLIFLLTLANGALAALVEVKEIRFWSSEQYTRVVIDVSNRVEFSRNRLSNPDRLYFDLKDALVSRDITKSIPIGDGILKGVRAGQFDKTTVRIVLDLEAISDYQAFLLDGPPRLVIDVYGKSQTVVKPDVQAFRRRIVVDPGHGGHDPGAVGPKNLFEKDIVLDIALKVKKILSEDPLNEVFLTRESDIYIPLEERTAFANRKNADLFISIHANASPRREARGIETYLLNWTDDEEAMRVAARENAISMKTMKAMNKQMDIVDIIKSDLIRENKRDESIKLAHYVQRSLVSHVNGHNGCGPNLGVKQALFYVLFGAKMPSVLVEVSFISNPEEERLLADDAFRTSIAKGIAKGISTYITATPAVQKIVDSQRRPFTYW